MRGTSTVSVYAFYGVGSRHEPPATNGISHFLEHLVFKGTPRRPSTKILSQELDGVGAMHNAYTSKDRTAFYVKAPAEYLELAVDVVADITINPLLDGEELNRERGVIAEEINMYEDNPMIIIDDVVEEQLFAGHSLGQRVIGPVGNIKTGITKEMIDSHHQSFYHPANAVVVVAGKCDLNKVMELVKKYFVYKTPAQLVGEMAKFSATQKQPRFIAKAKPGEQITMALAWPGFGLTHRSTPTAQVLANLLGGTMSSRLFLEVRERLGLCYFISAAHSNLADTGSFMISAGLDKTRLKEAIKVIRQVVEGVVRQTPPIEEVQRSITNIISRITMKVEESSILADWLGTSLILTNKLQTPRRLIKAVQKVTPDQVQQVAAKILNWQRCNLACIGPVSDSAALQQLIKP